MTTMLERLKQKLASSSKEEILKKWNAGKHWDSCGPKVKEYFNGQSHIHLEYERVQIDLGNMKINNILGSNLYSNLFFNLKIQCKQQLFN